MHMHTHRTSQDYHPELTISMEIDEYSIRCMGQYLEASVRHHAYPPNTSIYGSPWKFALSIACHARGG